MVNKEALWLAAVSAVTGLSGWLLYRWGHQFLLTAAVLDRLHEDQVSDIKDLSQALANLKDKEKFKSNGVFLLRGRVAADKLAADSDSLLTVASRHAGLGSPLAEPHQETARPFADHESDRIGLANKNNRLSDERLHRPETEPGIEAREPDDPQIRRERNARDGSAFKPGDAVGPVQQAVQRTGVFGRNCVFRHRVFLPREAADVPGTRE